MASNNINVYIPDAIEQLIKLNPERCKAFYTNNKLTDFSEDDIVKCSFLKGLFKVIGPETDGSGKLVIYPIDYKGDFHNVSPEFLRKIEVNEKAIKVLYED